MTLRESGLRLPPAVAPLVEALLDGVDDALGESFVGFYLCGSLSLGGFDAKTRDETRVAEVLELLSWAAERTE